jgi:hypothetical protein
MRLYQVAKRHGPAPAAETLALAIAGEDAEKFSRYRKVQVLDAANVENMQKTMYELWDHLGAVSRDKKTREYLLDLIDGLWGPGGQEGFLREQEKKGYFVREPKNKV